MKVTAIISDELLRDVQKFTNGKNLTDSLVKALEEWVYSKRIAELSENLVKEPLQFVEGYSASKVRKLSNRK